METVTARHKKTIKKKPQAEEHFLFAGNACGVLINGTYKILYVKGVYRPPETRSHFHDPLIILTLFRTSPLSSECSFYKNTDEVAFTPGKGEVNHLHASFH